MELPSGTFNTSYRKEMAIVRTGWQWALLIISLVLLFTFPLFVSNKWLGFLTITFITIIAVHGLNILTGYCGQVSIGHAAFVAVGAYVSALLTKEVGLPFWVALPGAGLAAGVVGLIIGAPSLRVKGFYLAIATLAAQFLILYVIVRLDSITGGTRGFYVPAAQIGGLVFKPERSYYLLALTMVIIMTFFARNLARSKTGRALVAVRDNELAAEVLGVSLFRYKFLAFFIGCFYAGIAGSLLAHYMFTISPDYFTLWESIWYVGMLIVGGIGSTAGVIFGVLFFRLLNTGVSVGAPAIGRVFPAVGAEILGALGLIAFGLAIVLFLIFEPRGLAHRWEIYKASYRLWPFSY